MYHEKHNREPLKIALVRKILQIFENEFLEVAENKTH
jgi:hypothetical protein